MRIGLSFDLRQEYLDQGYGLEQTAEFDSEETIAAIESTLGELGFETERIGNAQSLVRSLALGKRWDMVFNIAEGLHGLGRESLVPALLDAWRVPYVFSEPMTLSLCLHKGMTKHVIRDLGLPTPDFMVVERLRDLDEFRLGFPVFAKPVAEGTGKGVSGASICRDAAQLEQVCAALLQCFEQPVLLEEYLQGREFTVGIVGTGPEARVLGVMEVFMLTEHEQGAYGYGNKAEYEKFVSYALVEDSQARRAADVALAAYRALGIRDAGRLDLRAAGMNPRSEVHFIEANPLAGLHPGHSDLPILCGLAKTSYTSLLAMIMESALRRHNAQAAAQDSQGTLEAA